VKESAEGAAVRSGRRGRTRLGSTTGLDEFDIGDFSSELQDAQTLLSLGIDSATFRTQVLKRLALKYLCDVRRGQGEDRAGDLTRAGRAVMRGRSKS